MEAAEPKAAAAAAASSEQLLKPNANIEEAYHELWSPPSSAVDFAVLGLAVPDPLALPPSTSTSTDTKENINPNTCLTLTDPELDEDDLDCLRALDTYQEQEKDQKQTQKQNQNQERKTKKFSIFRATKNHWMRSRIRSRSRRDKIARKVTAEPSTRV